MTREEIKNASITKTEKIKLLLESGMTRREVADYLQVGYGFVQNVYARQFGVARTNRRRGTAEINLNEFVFNRNFGVEIECFNVNKTIFLQLINSQGILICEEGYNHTTRAHWKIVPDSSISGNMACEIVSPVLNGEEGLRQLKIITETLSAVNAKVNRTCGMHIHFEARDFDLQTWKNIYLN